MAEALDISIPAVRESVLAVRDRLTACGFAVVDDGVQVELVILPHAAEAVSRLRELGGVRAMTPDALEVLVIVGHLGEATRRQIEERRLRDSAGLLDRLAQRSLVEKR